MSRFQIVPTIKGEEKIGGYTVLDVRAVGDTAKQSDDIRIAGKIGENQYKWLTGLKPEHLDYAPGLTKEEKEKYKKQLEEDLQLLNRMFSPEEYDDKNSYFWRERQMGKIFLDSSIESTFFDTKLNPRHILIKYAILAGSYDLVASSYERARDIKAPYYMTSMEEEDVRNFTPVNEKLQASAKLYEFTVNANEQNVLWFAWALDKTTNGFTRTNSKGVVTTALVSFLEGKLTKSGVAKKQCAKKVLDLLNEWDVNKESVITKGIFHAAVHFGHIFYDKGFYHTSERRTKLLPSIEDSIALLQDPLLRDELVEIRDKVKAELDK